MSTNKRIDCWTIYDHPNDWPSHYVARRHVIVGSQHIATQQFFAAETLDEVRKKIPRGLWRFERSAEDDPVIVESWM